MGRAGQAVLVPAWGAGMDGEPASFPAYSIVALGGGKRSRDAAQAAGHALRQKAKEAREAQQKAHGRSPGDQGGGLSQVPGQQAVGTGPAKGSAGGTGPPGARPLRSSDPAKPAAAEVSPIDIHSLTQEVQTAPRFGLNGKALILRAAASASTKERPPPGAGTGPGSRKRVMSDFHMQAAAPSITWKAAELVALVPANEQPFVTYVPRSNIPRLLRQNGVQSLLGLYLVHLLQLLGLRDHAAGLQLIKTDSDVRKAAGVAAAAHETALYKQVTSKQAYSQVLAGAKCRPELVPAEMLKTLKQRHPPPAEPAGAGAGGGGGGGRRVGAGHKSQTGEGGQKIEGERQAKKRRKRNGDEDLFGSDDDGEADGEDEDEDEDEDEEEGDGDGGVEQGEAMENERGEGREGQGDAVEGDAALQGAAPQVDEMASPEAGDQHDSAPEHGSRGAAESEPADTKASGAGAGDDAGQELCVSSVAAATPKRDEGAREAHKQPAVTQTREGTPGSDPVQLSEQGGEAATDRRDCEVRVDGSGTRATDGPEPQGHSHAACDATPSQQQGIQAAAAANSPQRKQVQEDEQQQEAGEQRHGGNQQAEGQLDSGPGVRTGVSAANTSASGAEKGDANAPSSSRQPSERSEQSRSTAPDSQFKQRLKGSTQQHPKGSEHKQQEKKPPPSVPPATHPDAAQPKEVLQGAAKVKHQVTEFVKAVMEPMYRAGLVSRDVHKAVVKSAVTKILQRHVPPETSGAEVSADFLIEEAESIRRFVSALVAHERKVQAAAPAAASGAGAEAKGHDQVQGPV